MRSIAKDLAVLAAIAVLLFTISCGTTADVEPANEATRAVQLQPVPSPIPSASPMIPDLQAELTDDRFKAASTPLATFDFRNYSYPLPRGWQNPDGKDITLIDGKLAAIPNEISDDMSDEEKAARKAERRIGMSHVTTKFIDATGDGVEEAFVILQIETGGSAIPQIVYVFEWQEDKPELIWYFRTGDRADGGLKDLRPENGMLVVELFGQDRFLLGEVETGKILGDEEQLCCPLHFTRTFYKWNGRNFLMQGKRLTYLVADPSQPPIENMADEIANRERMKKR